MADALCQNRSAARARARAARSRCDPHTGTQPRDSIEESRNNPRARAHGHAHRTSGAFPQTGEVVTYKTPVGPSRLMPVLSCPRCKARVEIAAEATHATCHQCGFSAPRKPSAPAAPATTPASTAPGAQAVQATVAPQAQAQAPATGPAAVPTRAAPAKAAKAARKDRPRLSLLAAMGVAVVLNVAMQLVTSETLYLSVFILSVFMTPLIAGALGGYFTPGDRLSRTLNATGGATLGIAVAGLVGTLFVHPFAQRVAGIPITDPDLAAQLLPTLQATALLAAVGAVIAALGAYYLAEPEKPKAKAKPKAP